MIASEYRALAREERKNWWLRAKRMFLKTLLSGQFPKGSERTILDIGCGTGINFEVYRQFGKITAIDASPLALALSKKYTFVKVRKARATRLPFAARTFDVVTVIDVLYHKAIVDDRKALREINRVLKPGGVVLVVDCAHPWLFGPHDVNNMARERYTKRELAQKITAAGFRVVQSTYLYFFTFPFFCVQRLAQKYITKKETHSFEGELPLMNAVFLAFCRLENKILARAPLPWGSSLAFVGKKF